MGRVKPCAACGHPKSRHRTRECRHTVTDRPIAAHDAMEQHYASEHIADIAKAIAPRDGWITRRAQP